MTTPHDAHWRPSPKQRQVLIHARPNGLVMGPGNTMTSLKRRGLVRSLKGVPSNPCWLAGWLTDEGRQSASEVLDGTP